MQDMRVSFLIDGENKRWFKETLDRPGLLAQVVPGLLSDLQLRGSSPCINNYPAKKKKKKERLDSLWYEDRDAIFWVI